MLFASIRKHFGYLLLLIGVSLLGKGLFLKGNGDGTFTAALKIDDSGIFIPGNVKNLELLFILKEKRPAILVANNNSFLNLIAWTK